MGMSNPLLSFLVCYKSPERSDDPCNLFTVLEGLKNSIKPEDYGKIEFLIRIDSDDIVAYNKLVEYGYVAGYPMNIKVFQFKPWEGRYTFNYHYTFLFSQRAYCSKYVGFLTDDCLIHDKIKYMIEELETKYPDIEYGVFHSSETEVWPVPEHHKKFHVKERLEAITKMGDYKDLTVTQKWCSNFLTESYPIVTSKIFEIMGNCGWQVNIDSTLALLNVILYQKYGINIAFLLDSKSFSRLDAVRAEKEKPEPNSFNHRMTLNASKTSDDPYLYVLMEQQAKNIYLNMKEDGVLDKYLIKKE